MVKKAVAGVLLAGLVATFSFGRDVWSYARTASQAAHEAIKSEVPVEFEIQRARDMVQHLLPEIRRCMHVIAEEEVAIEQLQQEIAKSETELGKRKGEILALKKDLDSQNSTYKYAGRTFTQHDVKRDLAARFARFKTAEETLASRQQILNSRHRGLEAAREKLEVMLGSKRDLEVQIEHLDARVKTLQAAQSASAVVVDNSQLSRAKQLIADLNRQLDVTEKMLDAEGRFTGMIPVEADQVAPADLSREIDEYFSEPQPEQPVEKQARVDEPIDGLVAQD